MPKKPTTKKSPTSTTTKSAGGGDITPPSFGKGSRASSSRREEVKRWMARISQADRAYRHWSDLYSCDLLYDFYLGHQNPDALKTGIIQNEPYLLNLFFPTIEAGLPSLLFFKPQYLIRPKPSREDDPQSEVDGRAKLREDTLNTFIQDDEVGFDDAVPLAIMDAFARFGVVEVGLTADWVDNPNAGKPALSKDTGDPLVDKDNKPVIEPEKLVEDAQVYIKRIPAKNFRVAVNAQYKLVHNDWYGYCEWHYVEDLKKDKNLKNTAELKAGGSLRKDYSENPSPTVDPETQRHEGMVCVWKIWDLRAKKKLTLAEGHELPLREEDFDFPPHAIFRFHPILDEFYPLPPTFNWVHPQLEYNESRQMQRIHRRRFYRRYTYVDGTIDDSELQKLETGGDGVYAKANQANPIQAVEDAPLDAAVWRNLAVTKDDFREISGKGGEQRGVSDADTATQAAIIDSGSKLRDSFAKSGPWGVAKFLGEIGRLVLATVEKKLPLPFWVLTNVDPLSPGSWEESVNIAKIHKMITSKQLGDLDYDVTIDIDSMTPVTDDQERNRWTQVLTTLANPGLMVALTASDTILKKTMSFYGIRSSKELAEIKRAMQAVLTVLAGAQGGGAPSPDGGPPGVPSPAMGGSGPGPAPDSTAPQLGAQVGAAPPPGISGG